MLAALRFPSSCKPILHQAAALIKRLPPGVSVHIDGYAAPAADPVADPLLPRHRAEAVRRLLVEDGVSRTELKAKGHSAVHAAAGDDRGGGGIEFSVK